MGRYKEIICAISTAGYNKKIIKKEMLQKDG